MTVIAYSAKHKVIAADSRCSDSSGMHVTTCQKLFRLKNGAVLGTSGDSDDRDVRDLLGKVKLTKLPSRLQLAGAVLPVSRHHGLPNIRSVRCLHLAP